MTYFQFIKLVPERLSELYQPEECRTIAYRLLEDLLGISKKLYAINSTQLISEVDKNILLSSIDQMIKGRPLQYVTKFEWFRDKKYKVEEGVLIPRPETEELVSWVLEDIKLSDFDTKEKLDNNIKIFDAACGSGVIGISIASELLNAKVYACDNSDKAIEISNINAAEILGDSHIINYKIFKCDLLAMDIAESLLQREEFDIVISNPPYVCDSEKELLRPNVLLYEPEEALFVKDSNPLSFYERIATISAYSLKPGGAIYFEINERLSQEVINMLKNKGFTNAKVRKDFRNKERMVKVIKN